MVGCPMFKIKKNSKHLGWQLKGWSSFNRDGQGYGGVCLKAMTLAEITKVSFDKRRFKD